MFLMWLGEQITERGIGNGISHDYLCRYRRRAFRRQCRGSLELVRTGAMSIPVAAVFIAVLGGC